MFSENIKQKDGLHHSCKACMKAHQEELDAKADKRRQAKEEAERARQADVLAYRQAKQEYRNLIQDTIKANAEKQRQKRQIALEAEQAAVIAYRQAKQEYREATEEAKRAQAEERRQAKQAYREATERAKRIQAEEHRQQKVQYRELTRQILQEQAQAHRESKHLFVPGKQTSHQRRKAWIIANGGSHTKAEINALLEAQNHQCAYCKRQVKLTEDHVIPVSRGGSDYISNICMACWRCNHQKRARTPAQWIKRWYLLEPYNPDAP